MKKYAMYMHGGSENHGCEAIVRSTLGICKKPMILYSRVPEMEHKYKLDRLCTIKNRGTVTKRYTVSWFIKQVKKRLCGDKLAFIRDNYCNIINDADSGDVFFSIGGDNYCGELVPALQYTNAELNKKGVKTVLWGCSIDPKYMSKQENIDDLKRYSFIFAREKITYDALVKAGLKNARHYPDPAFTLKPHKWKLPKLFSEREIIGINISPYVQKSGSGQMVYDNYEKLISYLLTKTEYGVCLIPHVIWNESDDRIPSHKLYEKFRNTNRIVMLGDHNCEELKYCISKCKMLVTARTHASIAAYSTYIPTIVVGYSMKSKGLAVELFGTAKHYVVNAWDMKTDKVLLEDFLWLEKNYNKIKLYLKKKMPGYIAKGYKAAEELNELFND